MTHSLDQMKTINEIGNNNVLIVQLFSDIFYKIKLFHTDTIKM